MQLMKLFFSTFIGGLIGILTWEVLKKDSNISNLSLRYFIVLILAAMIIACISTLITYISIKIGASLSKRLMK